MVVTNRFVPLPVVYEHERFLVESLSLSGMYHVIARSARCMHKLLPAHRHGACLGGCPCPAALVAQATAVVPALSGGCWSCSSIAQALPPPGLAQGCRVCTGSESHSHVHML